jgi:hypothetical protein
MSGGMRKGNNASPTLVEKVRDDDEDPMSEPVHENP